MSITSDIQPILNTTDTLANERPTGAPNTPPKDSSNQVKGRALVGYWLRFLVRWFLTLCFLMYGMAKLFKLQFVNSGMLLERPVCDLSGIELTWIYFGSSEIFSNFVAFGQITSAVLLAFDRTARLGAAVLFPIVVNIVVVNFGFDIGTDTEILSIVLLACNLFLILGDVPVWKQVFWDQTRFDATRPGFMSGPIAGIGSCVGLFVIGLGLWLFMFWASNSLMPESELHGDWIVVSATVDGRSVHDERLGGGWRKICFEYHGQFGVRSKRGRFDGEYQCDPKTAEFTISFDPEPIPALPPVGVTLPDAEQRRLSPKSFAGFQWPVQVTGHYRREGKNLLISGRCRDEEFEWVLKPWVQQHLR